MNYDLFLSSNACVFFLYLHRERTFFLSRFTPSFSYILIKFVFFEMETDNDNTKSVEDWQLVSNLEPQLISRTSSSASSISSSIIEKRISKLGGLFTTSSSSLTSSSNYYDMLLSKFSRSSSTDSSKQTRLKEEVTHNLQLLKEQSLKKDTDWGKRENTLCIQNIHKQSILTLISMYKKKKKTRILGVCDI